MQRLSRKAWKTPSSPNPRQIPSESRSPSRENPGARPEATAARRATRNGRCTLEVAAHPLAVNPRFARVGLAAALGDSRAGGRQGAGYVPADAGAVRTGAAGPRG